MNPTLRTLKGSLTKAGKRTELFETGDGTRLLLLPYGARVVGLFGPADDESLYWANPALGSAKTARALFARSGWHNTGGDRTWLAPELDVFFCDHPKAETYWQPRQLDMSDYEVHRVDGGISMARPMSIHLGRTDCDVPLKLSKWLGPAANPLRRERDLARRLAGVQYAGYTQRTVLEIADGARRAKSGGSAAQGGQHAGQPRLGLWNLIQLPPGGELFVPLYCRTRPQPCFGAIPERYLTIDDRMLRLKVRFGGSHKISLRAVPVCGRAGYVYRSGDRWSLVVRNLFVNPSGDYIDVQKSDPDDLGYAFQVCRVDETEFGSFFELEYHAPAVGAPPDPARSEDVSQVWSFRGTRGAIRAIAARLLGVERLSNLP